MTRRRVPHRFDAPGVPDGLTLRLREPADVLAAIPFLLGFHPKDSLVALGMRQGRQVFAARLDLPADAATAVELRRQVDCLLPVMLRQDVSAVLLVAYGTDERARPLTAELHRAFELAGLKLLDAMRVEGDRYWSYLCAEAGCCPADGRTFDPSAARVAAECTVAGWVALPDRETYEAQVAPLGGPSRYGMRRAAARANERLFDLLTHPPDEGTVRDELLAAGAAATDAALAKQAGGERLCDDEVAWLAILTLSIPVRDAAGARICGDLDQLRRHRALWMEVMRRCQPDVSPGPYCLFALAAWRCGEGALARLALEQALDQDSGYALAGLLHEMIVRGVPPSALDDDLPWRRLRRRSARRPRRRSTSRRAGSRRG